jgi:mono/diheme cytochrome c family protein
MKKIFVALLLLPLAPCMAAAQGAAPAGDRQAGKALWDGPATQCRNCHGANGEGAFGPDLAGRKLTVAQFKQALRKPWGIMPAFIESQISDAEVGHLVAYFDGLPAVEAPGKWRFDVPANAARGQQVLLNVGCGQCHGPLLVGPRGNMGAVDMDFDWFRSLVYNHTTAYPLHASRLEEQMPIRVRMGNFNPNRVWESELQEIYNWAKNEVGFRARVAGRLAKGVPAANGVTYSLAVENAGLAGKGYSADDVVVRLIVPAGTEVVAATGDGYQGVRMDEGAKANVASWQVPRLVAKEHKALTITLSKAGTAADNLRGEIRWKASKPGPLETQTINPAPL